MQDASAEQNARPENISVWGFALTALQGRKTYSTLILTALLLAGDYLHWWKLPEQAFKGLQLLALGFLKLGIARESKRWSASETLTQPAAPLTGAASLSSGLNQTETKLRLESPESKTP